jgi:hypothetical protein
VEARGLGFRVLGLSAWERAYAVEALSVGVTVRPLSVHRPLHPLPHVLRLARKQITVHIHTHTHTHTNTNTRTERE